MAHKTELKLSLDAQDLPCLLSHLLLAAPAASQRLLNTIRDPRAGTQNPAHGRARAARGRATDFDRQRWFNHHAGARIEVALDQGRIHVPGTALQKALPKHGS